MSEIILSRNEHLKEYNLGISSIILNKEGYSPNSNHGISQNQKIYLYNYLLSFN